MQLVKELMSRDVKVISPDMTIGEAAKKMRDGGFGMMPVGEDDRMIGTISDRDITIRAVAEGKDGGTKVRDVMTWLDVRHVVPKESQVSLIVSLGFLVICLVNTVGLLLAKFMRRAPEIGVRRALGASRKDIYAQFLIEAGTIGVAGGVLGLILTGVGILGVGLVFPEPVARLARLDPVLILLTLIVAIVASLIAAFYPTWRAAQVQPACQLKSN